MAMHSDDKNSGNKPNAIANLAHKEIPLSEEGEAYWREFKNTLDWADGFELFFLFSQSPPLLNTFRTRLYYGLPLAKRELQIISPGEPQTQEDSPSPEENLTKRILSQLFPDQPDKPNPNRVIWIDLTFFHSPDNINLIREFLARLNERREALRLQLAVSCIIALPEEILKGLRFLAPDLWSIRNSTKVLKIPVHSLEGNIKETPGQYQVKEPSSANELTDKSEPQSYEQETQLSKITGISYKEWQRLCQKQSHRAALKEAYSLLWNRVDNLNQSQLQALLKWLQDFPTSIELSNFEKQMYHDCLGIARESMRQLNQALLAFEESLKIARLDNPQADSNSNQPGPPPLTLQIKTDEQAALRNISICLNRVANIQAQIGQTQNALDNYQESLSIRRKIQNISGDVPQTLRDISVSLNKVANIQAQIGQTQNALDNYQESLVIARKIQNISGDAPQTLRDISVSLDNVADIQAQIGQTQNALDNYQESLSIRRKIQNISGDAPQTLRDISVSLEKVANIQAQIGQTQNALDNYQESLSIRRKIQNISGDAPQTLRDISVSLNKVADIQAQIGQTQNALDNYQESLSIRRKIQNISGDAPQTLRDISVSLEKVANIQAQIGQTQNALDNYQESLSIRRNIQNISGDAPQTLRDTSVSLINVALLEAEREEKNNAISHFEEALHLMEQAKTISDFKDSLEQDCQYIRNQLATLKNS